MMEKNNTYGIYFCWKDIEEIVENNLGWIEIVQDQIFCVTNVMNDNTPIGTSIDVRVDGVTCESNSDTLLLSLSNGIYTLPVKMTRPQEAFDIRFDRTISAHGTYGCIVNGTIDILTTAEKEFKKAVDDQLGYRDDIYANEFRKVNTRNVGGRGLLLLEKIKVEIKANDILVEEGVTPSQLVAFFIDMTDKYIIASKTVEDLTVKYDALQSQYKETFDENSRNTKKLARDIDIVSRKIEANKDIIKFCLATIDTVIMPVLKMDVGR
jgi:hypothetical protein